MYSVHKNVVSDGGVQEKNPGVTIDSVMNPGPPSGNQEGLAGDVSMLFEPLCRIDSR